MAKNGLGHQAFISRTARSASVATMARGTYRGLQAVAPKPSPFERAKAPQALTRTRDFNHCAHIVFASSARWRSRRSKPVLCKGSYPPCPANTDTDDI